MVLLLSLAGVVSAAPPAPPVVELGEPYRVVDGRDKFYLLHGAEVVAVKLDGAHATIQRFSADGLRELSWRPYEDFPSGTEGETILQVEGKFYLIYGAYDAAASEGAIYAREVNPLSGAFSGPGRVLFSVEGRGLPDLRMAALPWAEWQRKVGVSRSADGRQVLIWYGLPDAEGDGATLPHALGLHVYGPGLEPSWHRRIELPHAPGHLTLWGAGVDGSGAAYIAWQFEPSASVAAAGELPAAGARGEILRITGESVGGDTVSFPLVEKRVRSARIIEGAGGSMLLCGLYRGVAGATAGAFTAFLRPGSTTPAVGFHALPDEFRQELSLAKLPFPHGALNAPLNNETLGRRSSQEPVLDPLRDALVVRSLVPEADGSVLLVAEQHQRIEVSVATTYHDMARAGMHDRTSTYRYWSSFFGDILAIKVTPEGTIAWQRLLPKQQLGGAGLGELSFAAFHSGQEHSFAYLSDVGQKGLHPCHDSGRPFDARFLSAYDMDGETGAVASYELLDVREVEGQKLYQLAMTRLVRVGPRTYILEAYKKRKEDILVKVRALGEGAVVPAPPEGASITPPR